MKIKAQRYPNQPWKEKVVAETYEVASLLNLEITSQGDGWVLGNGIKGVLEFGRLKWIQPDGKNIGGHVELIQYLRKVDEHTAKMMLEASAEALLALQYAYEYELEDQSSGKDSVWVSIQDTSILDDIEPESATLEVEDLEPWEVREQANQQKLIDDALIQIEKAKQETIQRELSLKQTFSALVAQEFSVGDSSCPPILLGDPSIVWFVANETEALAARSMGYVATIIVVESDIWQYCEKVIEILKHAEALSIVRSHEDDYLYNAIYSLHDSLLANISKYFTKFSPTVLEVQGEFNSLAAMAAHNRESKTSAIDTSQVSASYKCEQSVRAALDDEKYDPTGEFTDYSQDEFQTDIAVKPAAELTAKVLLFPSPVGAMPTWLTRVALFKSIGTRYQRKKVVKLKLACGAGVTSAFYSGEELGVIDETTWLACLRMCRKNAIGKRVTFEKAALLKDCGRAEGTANFSSLRQQLDRLREASLDIKYRTKPKDKKFPMETRVKTNLLKNWGVEKGTSRMWVQLDPNSVALFDFMAFQPWHTRLELSSDLTKKLLTYVSGHQNGELHSVTLKELQAQCGATGRLWDFRSQCFAALEQLESKSVLVAGFTKIEIEGDEEIVSWKREPVGVQESVNDNIDKVGCSAT